MTAFPATLPRPTIDGYGIEPDDPVARTEMDAGNVRSRRRFSAFPSIIPVRWRFKTAEFALFEAWHKHEALDGAAWFDVDLANGLGVDVWSAQFAAMWQARAQPGLGFAVTAQLRVRSRPLLTAEELEVASAYALDDIAAATPPLHALIHSTLPGYW